MKIKINHCKESQIIGEKLLFSASNKDYVFIRLRTPASFFTEKGLCQAKPNDFFLLKPGSSLEIVPEAGNVIYDELSFGGKDSHKLINLSTIDTNVVLTPLQSHFAESLFSKINLELLDKSHAWLEICGAYILELLSKTVRMVNHDLVESLPDHAQKLRDLRAEIHENYAYSWTINQMSEKMGLSTSRFASLYKKEFKISPTEDLIQTRIDQAKKMLSSSKVSIKKVSTACGFESVHYFHRAFKKRVYLTPKHFQNSKFVEEGSVFTSERHFSLDRLTQQSQYSGVIELIDGEIHFHGNTSHVSELLGYTPQQLKESPFLSFVAPSSISAAQGAIIQILSNKNVLDLSAELLHESGKTIPIRFSALLKGKNWFWFINSVPELTPA
jgi:AraC-like DNA-binding protein